MSDDRGKNIATLRKKRSGRPTISGPLPPGLPNNPSQGGSRSGLERKQSNNENRLDVPRARPQKNDKTSDLVKRRYSTRFTQLPGDFGAGAPPLPTVPKVPPQYRPRGPSAERRAAVSSDGTRIRVNPDTLQDPTLKPDQYIAELLADASDQDIRAFQQDLQKIKNRTSSDLQFNVYQNRTQFIKISKEAEKLKVEMRTLRTLMSELTSTLGQATSTNGLNTEALLALPQRNRGNRSSVANLEALWSTHLQTLWKRVEGSQKYLPAIPGRHIVYESGKWWELNAATWKARKRTHIILLNDHLLIAGEKKRPETSSQSPAKQKEKAPTQLVAVRCWPLQDVHVADLSAKSIPGGSDRPNAASAINVRVGQESWTFACSQQDIEQKAGLLSIFRRTMEELRQMQEEESEEREKARDSVQFLTNKDPSLWKKPDLLESLSDASSMKSGLTIEVDGKQQSIRWIESQLDDLDIDIALQKFEESVERIEKLRNLTNTMKSNAIAQDFVTFKVNERASRIAAVIVKQLVETSSWKEATQRDVDWLVRLGFEDRAREAYLEARSNVLRKRVRQCVFDGNLHHYIYQISYIYFTILRNTVGIYQTCFPTAMMSACVRWAKEHVDEFNIILARQLGGLDEKSVVKKECMARAHQHAKLLTEVGLDFKDLIGKDIEGNVGVDKSPIAERVQSSQRTQGALRPQVVQRTQEAPKAPVAQRVEEVQRPKVVQRAQEVRNSEYNDGGEDFA